MMRNADMDSKLGPSTVRRISYVGDDGSPSMPEARFFSFDVFDALAGFAKSKADLNRKNCRDCIRTSARTDE